MALHRFGLREGCATKSATKALSPDNFMQVFVIIWSIAAFVVLVELMQLRCSDRAVAVFRGHGLLASRKAFEQVVRCLRRFLVGAELDTWELLVGIAKELRKEIAIGQQQKPPSRVTSGWKSANVVFMLVKHEKNPRNEAASVIALYWRERMKLKRWRARPNEMLKTLEEILLRSISANLSESERQEISMAYKGTQRSYTRELAGV
eukprot:5463399-Prymnesium_polylepis.1